jgi:hypothetical protein
MSLRRFRFTLGLMVELIAVCAVLFALIRTPATPLILIIGAVVSGFIIDRIKGGTGIGGGALSGCPAFVSLGIVLCIYLYFFPEPGPFSASNQCYSLETPR